MATRNIDEARRVRLDHALVVERRISAIQHVIQRVRALDSWSTFDDMETRHHLLNAQRECDYESQ
eukprot:5998737-Prorocentrum_lima.AAC.1